jgi:DNA-binding Lrp family transcriptional regulator
MRDSFCFSGSYRRLFEIFRETFFNQLHSAILFMARPKLDGVDVGLLQALRVNARSTFSKLGRDLAVPSSTVYDRYGKLGGVIRRHATLVDFAGIGFPCCAFIRCSVPASLRPGLHAYLQGHPIVNSASVVNDRNSLLIEVIEQNPARVSDFVDALEQQFGVREVQTHFIAEEHAREAFTLK